MKTVKDMLTEARQVVPEEGPTELAKRLSAGEKVVVIDVRDPTSSATVIWRQRPTSAAVSSSSASGSGERSDDAGRALLPDRSALDARREGAEDLGYTHVVNLQGGYQKWVQSGLPIVKETANDDRPDPALQPPLPLAAGRRQGQRKLLRSKVLLIGAGGLGSPTALYLAAAGVGTLALMDGDVVDITNLQRQILHTTADVGKPKVESATRTLKALNPT
jgi:rhodanese-related sulfurtransferase